MEAWFEVPGKLPLFQLTLHNVAKDTRFDLALCNANWSLVNACIWALVIDINWIAARMPIELATLAKH